MVKSMTGFGQYKMETKEHKVSVEIKAVNHRYCDINIKMPKKFNVFESRIRTILKDYMARGKADIFISYESFQDKTSTVVYHPEIARGYFEAIQSDSSEFGIAGTVKAESLVRFPEVISLVENEEEVTQVFPLIEEAIHKAGAEFLEAREKEGQNLQKDLLAKLDFILELVEQIEKRSPEVVKEYRDKIIQKVNELLGSNDIDERVLATEITVFADKICVDEETVRLRSHVDAMREAFAAKIPIGRKLDFLSQEMNREANTILSKANDKELSNIAIDLKTEIEKIREQIQNIE